MGADYEDSQKQDQVQVLKACRGWSVLIVIWLNRMPKIMFGYWYLRQLRLDLFLDLALDKFGWFRPRRVHWKKGHAWCAGYTNYAGCTFHACEPNGSYRGGPSGYCMFFATSISTLRRGRWQAINSCTIGTVGGSCFAARLAELMFLWPAEVKDLELFLADWQHWGTSVVVMFSAHCNVEGTSWLLEAEPWQLSLSERQIKTLRDWRCLWYWRGERITVEWQLVEEDNDAMIIDLFNVLISIG